MQFLKYFIIFLGIATVTSRHVRFYRKDYTYMFDYDAFYKLHADTNTSWRTAFLTCENEDAKLFYPSEEDEWRIVEKLKERMEASANLTDVLIGVHNQFNVGEFFTVDGHSPPMSLGAELEHVEEGELCVIMDSVTGEYRKISCTRQLPTLFVCKKMDTQVCPNTICPTIDKDYKFSPASNKCYKVNENAKRWQEAMRTCYMEGGLLAVVKDTTEVQRILNVHMLHLNKSYFIGLYDLFNNGKYYTLKGENIGDISPKSHNWNGVINNGYIREQLGDETLSRNHLGCGVITNERIEGASCTSEMPFICEMETMQPCGYESAWRGSLDTSNCYMYHHACVLRKGRQRCIAVNTHLADVLWDECNRKSRLLPVYTAGSDSLMEGFEP